MVIGHIIPNELLILNSIIHLAERNSTDLHIGEILIYEVMRQRLSGNRNLIGLMVESNLEEGNQAVHAPRTALRYGVSVTDPCISWETTERLLRQTFTAVAKS